MLTTDVSECESSKNCIMKKVSHPNVKLLAKGQKFNAKEMEAKSGALLPKHTASIESVLIVLEGTCILELEGSDHILNKGDSFVVPPGIKHQIRVINDFKAVHVMTNDIQFKFFD